MSDIQALDEQFISGTYKRFPLTITAGHGSIAIDETGKEYIDLGAGIAVTSFGIADPQWQAAVIEQLGKVQHMSNLYYTEPGAILAQQLCERTGLRKVFFANSGAEANECAIKVARKYAADKYGTDRHVVVTLKQSFHGRTLATLAATGQDSFHETFLPLTPGFISIEPTVAALGELKSNDIAAVLIELVQGEGGVNVLDPEFVTALADYCATNDVLLMVDEVQTGNGRTGTLFAFEQFGLRPDIVTTAKGLAGGLPLGVAMFGEKTKDVLGSGDHGSTFGGNPVACAGALNIFSRIDDDLLAGVREKGAYLRQALTKMPGVSQVSGLGLMIGFSTELPVADVVAQCMERGVLLLTAKDKVRLLPALNIPQEQLEKAVAVISEVLS